MSDKKVRILVIEDEHAMANALRSKLSRAGFMTNIVTDGKKAIEELQTNSYDLILLDILMPAVDGWDVLKKISENKINTPVIITSNLSREEDIVKAKELGAEDFWVKSDTTLSDIVLRLQSRFDDKK